MLPYISMPDSPTDIDADGDGFSDVESYDSPLSPLDPHPVGRGGNRETAGNDFFSAVYLDSPLHPEAQEELEEARFGGTRPLRVKKKVPGTRIAGVGAAARHRRSNVSSVPHSPTSTIGHTQNPTTSGFTAPAPASPGINRSNTTSSTTSSLHPHHSISRLFLEGSPIPPSPPPMVPPKHIARTKPYAALGLGPHPQRAPSPRSQSHQNTAPARPSRPLRPPQPHTTRNLSPISNLHLNLGTFSPFDPSAMPGPSPPSSIASSPNRRAYIASQSIPPLPSPRPRRENPSSPLTPSRAPSKAAKLLGATMSEIGMPVPPTRYSDKNKDNFRPLPSQTLVEIDRFFGSVPAKPKKDTGASSKIAKISGPLHLGKDGMGDRNVGQGGSVRYKGDDGNMWLDVEEEQEFAWLMSESYRGDPTHTAPRSKSKSSKPSLSSLSSFDSAGKDYIAIETDLAWSKETLISVLSLPKPKKGPKAKPSADESFFDFGDDEEGFSGKSKSAKASKKAGKTDKGKGSKDSHKPPRLVFPANTLPWSSSTESLQVITPTRSGFTDAHLHFPGGSPTPDTTSDEDPFPPRSTSPPRLKNRPPPLTLAPKVINPRLPVISTTPTPRAKTQHTYHTQPVPLLPSLPPLPPLPHVTGPATNARKFRVDEDGAKTDRPGSMGPNTPFVRPRRAPIPGYKDSIPTLPKSHGPIAIPQLPPMPNMPAKYAPASYDAYGVPAEEMEDAMEISYFEPDTPTDASSNLQGKKGSGGFTRRGGGAVDGKAKNRDEKGRDERGRDEKGRDGKHGGGMGSGDGWLAKVVRQRGTRI